MKFAVINAKDEKLSVVDVEDINAAKHLAGLEPIGVDHGTVEDGLGIVVYEFGLLEPQQHYFILHRSLYAGNAVLYRYNKEGETIGIGNALDRYEITYFHSIEDVETSLRHGAAIRPFTAINNKQIAIWRHGQMRSL